MTETPLTENDPGFVRRIDPPVPGEVLAWQARVVLFRRGLTAAAEAAAQVVGGEAEIAFTHAPVWSRSGVLLNALATALDLAPEEIDEMFREAAGVSA